MFIYKTPKTNNKSIFFIVAIKIENAYNICIVE